MQEYREEIAKDGTLLVIVCNVIYTEFKEQERINSNYVHRL